MFFFPPGICIVRDDIGYCFLFRRPFRPLLLSGFSLTTFSINNRQFLVNVAVVLHCFHVCLMSVLTSQYTGKMCLLILRWNESLLRPGRASQK